MSTTSTSAQALSQDHADSAKEWRRLALQYDEHRMQALGHLRALLSSPVIHDEAARAFLAAAPLDGETVLAERIAALASQKPVTAPSPEQFLDAGLADVHDEGGVLTHYSREAALQCIAAALDYYAPNAAVSTCLGTEGGTTPASAENAAQASDSNWLWRHKKSGGLYRLVGSAKLQSDTPLADMSEVEVYRGGDGVLWVRAAQEFKDRFERAHPVALDASDAAQERAAAASEPRVTDAMVDAYLKAQRETVERVDREWGGRTGKASEHLQPVRAACRNGIQAAIESFEATETAEMLAAIAAEFREAIPTRDGAVLAAMIQEGVTVLGSHIQYALESTAGVNSQPTTSSRELQAAAQAALERLVWFGENGGRTVVALRAALAAAREVDLEKGANHG